MKFRFCNFSRVFQAGVRPGMAMSAALSAVVVALAMVGCSKTDKRLVVYAAEGRVTWKGKPLAGAQLAFYPQGASTDATTVTPRAQTDAEGRFKVKTYETADGAPEGEYAVTVLYYPMEKKDGGWVAGANAVPAKYSNPKTTDLRVQVAKQANTLPILSLQ